jgi:hypothetical protein
MRKLILSFILLSTFLTIKADILGPYSVTQDPDIPDGYVQIIAYNSTEIAGCYFKVTDENGYEYTIFYVPTGNGGVPPLKYYVDRNSTYTVTEINIPEGHILRSNFGDLSVGSTFSGGGYINIY